MVLRLVENPPSMEDDSGFKWDESTNVLTITGGIVVPAIGPAAAQQHLLPSVASDTVVLSGNTKIAVRKNTGAVVGTRRRLNLIEGANVTLTVADDATDEEVDVTIAATTQYVAATTNSVTRTVSITAGTTETVLDTMMLVLPAGVTKLVTGASYSAESYVSAHATHLRLYVAGVNCVTAILSTPPGVVNAMSVSALVTGLPAGGSITVETRGVTSTDTSVFNAATWAPSHLWAHSLC